MILTTNKTIHKKMEINLLINPIDKQVECKKDKNFHSLKKHNLEREFLSKPNK